MLHISIIYNLLHLSKDAHNAIINFDDHTSFFAVYDGHGGHEVAEYTAKKLPAFIKENKDYQDGNMHKVMLKCWIFFIDKVQDNTIFGLRYLDYKVINLFFVGSCWLFCRVWSDNR